MNDTRDQLADILDASSVIDDLEVLGAYSRDESFVAARKPRLVVKPKSADQVQMIVKWANQTGTPLVPVSSGPPHFRGDTVPAAGGAVIVDLSGMNRIIRIDRRNRVVMIEPGVTFSQLQPELAKEGLKLSLPLLPRGNKSVVASLLEREPIMVPKYQWSMIEPLRCLEIIWGSGDKLVTGDAGMWGPLEKQWDMRQAQLLAHGGAQTDWCRFVTGAQGSMGIVTWATVKCEILPQLHKTFFVPSETLDQLLNLTYRVLRFRYCDELLVLNSANLASILGESADQVRVLREELPPWVLILGVAGRDRLPEDRVEFQVNDISDIAQQFGLRLSPALPGAREGQVLAALVNPATEPYWKLRYKGGGQDVFFLTTLNRTPEFLNAMYSLSQERGYSSSDIGVYIQPLMGGVCCHCEFSLPYSPDDQKEIAKVRSLVTEGSETLMNRGAFFSRPYGAWASMAYNRDAQTTITLKKIKGIFDPNNVMNPGKLCF